MSQYATIPKLSNYTIVFQQQDIIINNSEVKVNTDLIYPLVSGKTYFIQTRTWINSDVLADFAFSLIDIPTYTFAKWGQSLVKINIALETEQVETTQTGIWEVLEIFIIIIVTQASTMRLQVAQLTAHPSNTTFAKGSFSIIWEI